MLSQNYVPSTDGNSVICLGSSSTNSNVTLSQSIAGLTTGSSYQLSFDHMLNGGQSSGEAVMEVLWNGTVIATIDSSFQSGWLSKSYTVTAAASNQITFAKSELAVEVGAQAWITSA